jgi:hypothetical protein
MGSGASHFDPIQPRLHLYFTKPFGAPGPPSNYRGFITNVEHADAHQRWYCLAEGSTADHTAAEADAEIEPVGPVHDDLPALNTWLDQTGIPQAILDDLEADGYPMDWVVPGVTTRRQVFKALSQGIRIHQRMRGFPGLTKAQRFDALRFAGRGLTTTVSAIPVTYRNAAEAWMTAHGLDTSWITGSTTLRQVLRYIADTIGWRGLRWDPDLDTE